MWDTRVAARSRSPTACSRGLSGRRNAPSDYGRTLQNMVPLWGTWLGRTGGHCSVPVTAGGSTEHIQAGPSAHTGVPVSPVQGLGVTSDVWDTTLGHKPTVSLLLHFPGKHFQGNIRVVYVAEAQFQRKSCPVKFLGSGPCQKPQDRHSRD